MFGQNNWSGSANDKKLRLQGIGRYLAESGVDVAVLNEVDFDAFWSHGEDQAMIIAEAGGYGFVARQINYKVNIPFASLAFGNAIVSRYPIISAAHESLSPLKGYEPLVYGNHDALQSQIDLGDVTLSLWGIHLEYRDEATRIAALDAISTRGGNKAILAGDFNSGPSKNGSATAFDLLLSATNMTTVPDRRGLQFTFPTQKLKRAIDWIVLPPEWHLLSGWVGTFDQSDHLPVHALVSNNGRGS